MTAKKRAKVPAAIVARVLHEADRACCICRTPGRPLQIHHIDNDPSNSRLENLAALCLDHHHEASSRSSIGRALSPLLVAKYRDEWLAVVREQRTARLKNGVTEVTPHEELLEALACHEIRKQAHGIGGDDWDAAEAALASIYPYVADWLYGDKVRQEAISAAYSVASCARMGIPPGAAAQVREVTTTALPVVSLVWASQSTISRTRHDLFLTAVSTGHSLAYDGVRYLENLAIVDSGGDILWAVLRFATLNDLSELADAALREFASLEEAARNASFSDASIWLEAQRRDALALPGSEALPEYPDALDKIIMDIRYQ